MSVIESNLYHNANTKELEESTRGKRRTRGKYYSATSIFRTLKGKRKVFVLKFNLYNMDTKGLEEIVEEKVCMCNTNSGTSVKFRYFAGLRETFQ